MPKSAPTERELFQETYDQRFGCCICLGPKLRMVSGKCQHRICDDCIYRGQTRRACMERCPVCGMSDSFPLIRPVLPAEVMSVQRMIGVMECPNSCPTLMWIWEVEEHLRCCPKSSENEEEKIKSKTSTSHRCKSKPAESSHVTMRTTRSAQRRTKSSRSVPRRSRRSHNSSHL